MRNYAYTNPATGLTSGKPTSLPIFAFTIPYSGTATGASLWNSNTVLSDYDLSNEDHTILYGYFRSSQVGAGSTLYQYYLPATNWDTGATPGCNGCTITEWTPTINYIGRNSCASNYGSLKNSSYAYPFIPNLNYDTERGLLQKTTQFNDAGNEVGESSYTYQRSFTPSVINAFKYDDNVNGGLLVKTYNKYSIYYNTSELTATVTTKVFDSSTLSQAQSTTVSYVYGSSQHKLPTQQSVTNSDNSIITTNTRYIKDYVAAPGSNENVNAIYYLQQQNVNTKVETWQQLIRAGSTKTTAASLTLFKGFTPGSNTLYLPSRQLAFIQPDGTNSFTPYSINGQISAADPQYLAQVNYISYDNAGYQQTTDDGNKNIKTVIIDHATNNPSATFINAGYNEIGFSDFDTDPVSSQLCNFTITGSGSFTSNESHSGAAFGLGTGQAITKTISVRNPKVSNYIFSIWINSPTAGNLNFTLSGGTTLNVAKAFSAAGWTYYEWKLPVNNASSAFTISITSSQAISIDDLLFYPDIARASTAGYDPLTGYLITETNTNGISTYYQKDKWGRLLFQYDQDRNIIKKRSYFTTAELPLTLLPPTVSQTTAVAFVPTDFDVNSSPCLTGVTYTWNFGDGTPVVTAFNGKVQSHTYTNIGNYTITVTATHSTLGTLSTTQTISVSPPNLSPQICQSGVHGWDTDTHTAAQMVTCGTNPSDNHTSYYTVTSVGQSFGTLSYTWQISYNNGVKWTNLGGSSSAAQISIDCTNTSKTYIIRCLVTSTTGQNGTSNNCNFLALPFGMGPP